MALIVQKYGGTSVGTLERIHHVLRKVIKRKTARTRCCRGCFCYAWRNRPFNPISANA